MKDDSRVAVIGIIVENTENISELNELLHTYSPYILGRMGIPYHKKDISIISLAVDGPIDKINELTGKIGKLQDISVKTAFSSK